MRHGKLLVLGDAGRDKHQKKLWLVRCDCGKEAVKLATEVRNGHTRSCGCLKSAGNRRSHGRRQSNHGKPSPEYVAWCNMKARCDNPGWNGFHNYGGRGISYCERWRSFENFFADMGERPPGFTLERNDVHGDYKPLNCRWATRKEQSENRRDNHLVTHKGETLTVSQWAERLGVNYITLLYRLRRGIPLERALQSGSCRKGRRGSKVISYEGETMTVSQWAERIGVSYGVLLSRVKRGVPLERALQPRIYRYRPQGKPL